MEYKVVPIIPVLKENETINHIAKDMESIIKKYADDGWQYVGTESLKTWVNPAGGCFGLGVTPGYYSEKQMMVFKK